MHIWELNMYYEDICKYDYLVSTSSYRNMVSPLISSGVQPAFIQDQNDQ